MRVWDPWTGAERLRASHAGPAVWADIVWGRLVSATQDKQLGFWKPEAAGLPFRLFVGGPLGSGRQRFTWIHVVDAVGLYNLAIRDESIVGPLNMVAPEVPTQRDLARAIGRAMRRPAIVPVPAAILRLVLWGQADIVLHGRVAVPAQALAAGYVFRHPTVESALRDALGRR